MKLKTTMQMSILKLTISRKLGGVPAPNKLCFTDHCVESLSAPGNILHSRSFLQLHAGDDQKADKAISFRADFITAWRSDGELEKH